MKRILFMLLLVSFAVGASAQWKVARVKQKFVSEPKEGYSLERGEIVCFSENRNGTITIYFDPGGDSPRERLGTYSKNFKNKYLEETVYYAASVRDPVDDYVNVRKGPRTNYPVVGKLNVESDIYYQKTDSNWFKVYVYNWDGEYKDDDGFFIGHRVLSYEPSDCIFVGYIYKDRVKSPNLDY